MRDLRVIVFALGVALGIPAQADEKPAAAHKSPAAAKQSIVARTLKTPPGKRAACANPNALGVARTIEIDTKNGPRFGLFQYKRHDILKPGEVVLTFDDGPLPAYTMQILKALEHHCTKATFFPVGRMAIAFPATLREIARRGHTIGSHTWSHRRQLGRSSYARAHHEIEMGISAVRRALGKPIAPFFRFPFLSDQRAAMAHLSRRNISTFSISIDSNDYRTRSGQRVVRAIMRQLKSSGKGIALFHDIQVSSARAMPAMLDRLKAGGYRIVHLKAKSPGTTLADYDRLAERKFLAKHGTDAERKLARRGGAWPKVGDAPITAAIHGTIKPGSFAAAPDTSPGGLAPLLPAARPPGASSDGDWRQKVFDPDEN